MSNRRPKGRALVEEWKQKRHHNSIPHNDPVCLEIEKRSNPNLARRRKVKGIAKRRRGGRIVSSVIDTQKPIEIINLGQGQEGCVNTCDLWGYLQWTAPGVREGGIADSVGGDGRRAKRGSTSS